MTLVVGITGALTVAQIIVVVIANQRNWPGRQGLFHVVAAIGCAAAWRAADHGDSQAWVWAVAISVLTLLPTIAERRKGT